MATKKKALKKPLANKKLKKVRGGGFADGSTRLADPTPGRVVPAPPRTSS